MSYSAVSLLRKVSILVMMELAHEEFKANGEDLDGLRFNPCYDGIGSRSGQLTR